MEQREGTREGELEARVLAEIKGVYLFRLLDNNKQLLSKGTLRICSLAEQNVYYINIDDFYFTIQKQIPFVSAPFNTFNSYVFPHIESGYNAISIDFDESVITQLEIILANIGTFIPKEALPYQDEALRNSLARHCINLFEVPLIDDDATLHYIKKGGSLLKEGFTWIGKVTASGVNKAGEYIGSKITTTNKVEVSSETKEKFNKIKDTTKSTLKVTGEFFGAVLTPMVAATEKFVNTMNEKIDQGNNETLKKIKKVGNATLDATTEAFSGLTTGAKEIGKTIGDNTRTIVEKKYGDDITNTFVGKPEEPSQSAETKSNPLA